MVGEDPEANVGGISSASIGDSEPAMVKQWRYYDGDGKKWCTDDNTLTVKGGPLPTYPAQVNITSRGPAKDKHSDCMGQYQQLAGVTRNLRPVWEHTQNKGNFLFYSDVGNWVVGDDYNDTAGRLRS